MTTQLIPVSQTTISNQTIPTVNARDLHQFLEVGKDFSNWIKDRIESFGFVDNQDFVIFANSGEKGRPAKEYALTLDMAKELSMVERNEKGKQARQYFIDCERKAKSIPSDPMQVLEIMFSAMKNQTAEIAEIKAEVQEVKNSMRLENWQQVRLQQLVASKVGGWTDEGKVNRITARFAFQSTWRAVKNYFQVARYNEIPASRYSEASDFIKNIECPV